MSRAHERRKNRAASVLITTLIVLAIVCFFVVAYLKETRGTGSEDIAVTIEEDGTLSETLEVDGLTVLPGGSDEYVINVNCKTSGKYRINLAFEREDDKGMAQYVDVQILSGGEVIAEDSLSDLLNGAKLTFTESFSFGTPMELTIKYSIGEDKGNEVMGTSTSFDIVMSAQKAL